MKTLRIVAVAMLFAGVSIILAVVYELLTGTTFIFVGWTLCVLGAAIELAASWVLSRRDRQPARMLMERLLHPPSTPRIEDRERVTKWLNDAWEKAFGNQNHRGK